MFEQLSVFKKLELALALKTHQGVPSSLFFRIDSAQQDRLAEVLHTIHLAASVRRMAGMADEETERTAELFLTLKGKHSLMVVEHDMSFIRGISEKVTVLCDGAVLAEGALDQVQGDERVIEVCLGR